MTTRSAITPMLELLADVAVSYLANNWILRRNRHRQFALETASVVHWRVLRQFNCETGRVLGKDSGDLREKITLHRAVKQHPNRGADIGTDSPYELSAFRQALESMLALYDLD